jgi:hypothetical protein
LAAVMRAFLRFMGGREEKAAWFSLRKVKTFVS